MEVLGSWILNHSGVLIGGLWALVLPLLARWVRSEVRPYIQTERRRRMAQWIGYLADDLTDELRVRYPQSQWIQRLDEAVDTLSEAAGIAPEVARRAIHAAAGRKLDGPPTSGVPAS